LNGGIRRRAQWWRLPRLRPAFRA